MIYDTRLKPTAAEQKRGADTKTGSNAPHLNENLTKSEDSLLLQLQHNIRVGIYRKQKSKRAENRQSSAGLDTNTRIERFQPCYDP